MTVQEITLKREFSDTYDGLNLLVMLLMIRIEQLQDSVAFYILATIEYYDFDGEMDFKLLLLFLMDPLFFIQQSAKYQGSHLIESLAYYFSKVFVSEYFFIEKRAELKINLKAGQLFLYSPTDENEYEYGVNDKLKQIVTEQPTELAYFMPIKTEENLKQWKYLFSTWQEGILYFHNFGDYWVKDLLSQLTEDEKTIYNEDIYPELRKIIIRNYYVHSELSFAYLKKEPNDKSDTLKTIANGEYVCFLEDDSKYIRYKNRIEETFMDDLGDDDGYREHMKFIVVKKTLQIVVMTWVIVLVGKQVDG